MVSYTADSHTLYGALYRWEAAKYPAGAMMTIREWDSGKIVGEIPQAAETYSVIGNINEHQLLIGESTWGGLSQLVDETGLIDYGTLIYTALQRCKTAREAIQLMTWMVGEYGYSSSGESFSIADPNEVWILELVGKGTKMVDGVNVNKGAVWVAVRIPDGMVSAHANQARITTFPLNDPENCLYSPDVISFARESGLYKGKDKDFSFSDTYNPLDFGAMRGCEARVWSVFRRIADNMDQYEDYAMGYNPKNRMPLWVKPNRKLDVKDMAELLRDHYQGTKMDMTQDVGAGGHNMPYRWRPMEWEYEGETYVNERALATQQTGWWFVGECRNWLPNPVGGVLWFGVDDTATSPLTPIYCGSTRVPWCFSEENGHMTEYSPTSMFWLQNRVTNFAYLRYDRISADIKRSMDRFELQCLAEQPTIDKIAAEIYNADREAGLEFVTKYSENKAQELFDTWTKLDHYLLVKFIDGNVKKESSEGVFIDNGNGHKIPVSPEWPGYNEKWKKQVVEDHGDVIRVVK